MLNNRKLNDKNDRERGTLKRGVNVSVHFELGFGITVMVYRLNGHLICIIQHKLGSPRCRATETMQLVLSPVFSCVSETLVRDRGQEVVQRPSSPQSEELSFQRKSGLCRCCWVFSFIDESEEASVWTEVCWTLQREQGSRSLSFPFSSTWAAAIVFVFVSFLYKWLYPAN